jgi:hypothetical protein
MRDVEEQITLQNISADSVFKWLTVYFLSSAIGVMIINISLSNMPLYIRNKPNKIASINRHHVSRTTEIFFYMYFQLTLAVEVAVEMDLNQRPSQGSPAGQRHILSM